MKNPEHFKWDGRAWMGECDTREKDKEVGERDRMEADIIRSEREYVRVHVYVRYCVYMYLYCLCRDIMRESVGGCTPFWTE